MYLHAKLIAPTYNPFTITVLARNFNTMKLFISPYNSYLGIDNPLLLSHSSLDCKASQSPAAVQLSSSQKLRASQAAVGMWGLDLYV